MLTRRGHRSGTGDKYGLGVCYPTKSNITTLRRVVMMELCSCNTYTFSTLRNT